MKLIAVIAEQSIPKPIHILNNELNYSDNELEEWGKAIVEELKKLGYYISKVKGDPSGRW